MTGSILFAAAEPGPIGLLYLTLGVLSAVLSGYTAWRMAHTYAVKHFGYSEGTNDYNTFLGLATMVTCLATGIPTAVLGFEVGVLAALLAVAGSIPALLLVVFLIHGSCVGVYRLVSWVQTRI